MTKKPTASKADKEIKELTDALKRERADSINLRRRHEADMAVIRERVKASVVSELLPVIDNFELALKHAPKDLDGSDYVRGIEAIVRQFEKTLSDLGVEKIKTVGHEFDPRVHEAVAHEEGEGKRHLIDEEIRAGYQIGDDVLRPALVRVSTKD